MRKVVAAAGVVALLLGACTDGDEPNGDGTPSPSPTAPAPASPSEAAPSPTASAEASAAPVDVSTTPEQITPEWVTAVVNTLLEDYGRISAEILAMPVSDDPMLPGDYQAQIERLFDGQYLDRRITTVQEIRVNLDDFRSRLLPSDQYRGLRFEAEAIQYAQDTCIIAVGRVDRAGTIPDGGPSEVLSAVSLERRQEPDSGPTEWTLVDELPNSANGEPLPDATMLDADLADYEGALDNSCDEDSA